LRLAFASPVPPDIARPPLRQRVTSFVLAVAITLLIILGMLGLNGTAEKRPQFKGGPVVLDLKDDADRADATRKASPKPAPAQPEPAPPRVKPPPPVPVPPPLPVPEDMSTHYIHLTPEENDAADISRHPRVAMSNSAGTQSAQQAVGTGAGDSQPIGTAPNGQPLYKAEWYRRPTHAELQTYLPPHMPSHGIGVVACRTIANHHVDDCVELGSSPPGSHLAGAVRQAAWQFLVRPPRLGGRELVGAWVSIEIDYDIKPADKPETTDDAPASGD
jgi:protein TonB